MNPRDVIATLVRLSNETRAAAKVVNDTPDKTGDNSSQWSRGQAEALAGAAADLLWRTACVLGAQFDISVTEIDEALDHLLRDSALPSLSDMFGAGDRYEFQPDWSTVLKAVRAAREALAANGAKTGNARVTKVAFSPFTAPAELPTSAAGALAAYAKERARKGNGGSYSNRVGDFFMGEPMKIRALIPGTETSYTQAMRPELPPGPAVYVVYEAADADWYLQALEITAEMCEWVLGQPDVEKYWLHWSG